MIIHWEGRDWQLDFSDLTIRQAEAIEQAAGMPVGQFLDALGEGLGMGSPQFLPCMRILYWLMLDQNGERQPIGAVDFPLVKFGRAFAEADEAEQAKGAPKPAQAVLPDPTLAGRSPETASPGPSIPAAFQRPANGAVPSPSARV